MRNNPLISVIIPIYNAQNYLNKCVDSILSQTFTDFEVLLINDGSTDASIDICNNYKGNDSRIKIFNKENGGVSSARNIGIFNAQGVYTIHLDSDDYVLPEMLEKMYNKALEENLDIVVADFYSKNNKQIIKVNQNIPESSQIMISGILEGKIHGSTWNKLIRTSLFKENSIKFDEEVTFCEDLLFIIECLLQNPKIGKINEAFLFYIQRKDSAIRTYNLKMFNGHFKIINKLELLLDESYSDSISYFKLLAKRNMVLSGLFSQNEIKSKYRDTTHLILKNKYLRLYDKIYLYLSVYGLYFVATKLIRVHRYIKNKRLR